MEPIKEEEDSSAPIKLVDSSADAGPQAIQAAAPEAPAEGDPPPPEPQAEAGELGEVEETTGEAARTPDVAELQAQVAALAQERGQFYDRLLRAQAEFENYRRRVEREKGEAREHHRAAVLSALLPVLDNFERALDSLSDSPADAGALRQGVELIHRQLRDALTGLGLQPVEAVGKAFDPHLHEAISTEPTDEHAENTVIEEFQRGYKLGERLLRPARVKVAASPNR